MPIHIWEALLCRALYVNSWFTGDNHNHNPYPLLLGLSYFQLSSHAWFKCLGAWCWWCREHQTKDANKHLDHFFSFCFCCWVGNTFGKACEACSTLDLILLSLHDLNFEYTVLRLVGTLECFANSCTEIVEVEKKWKIKC